jgi:tetratricopeptide (TPR) repeat protein
MGSMREGARLFASRRYEQALAEFLDLGEERVEGVELAYYLGLCLARLGRHDDALLYLEQVVTGSDDVMRVYQCRLALAWAYSVTGRGALAEFELKKLLEAGFESFLVRTQMAYALYLQGRAEEAIDQYELALESEPRSASALNNLGFILAEKGRDLDRALLCCKRAVDISPGNPAFLDSLGYAHYRKGNRQEARLWLRRALDAAPGRKEIADHLRDAMEGGV